METRSKEVVKCGGQGQAKTAPISNLVMQSYLNHALHEMSLLHNHPSVMVLPFRDEPERVIKPYRPRRVVSPYEFIMEYVLDGQEYYYDQWFPQMQSYYEENKEAMKLTDDHTLHPNSCFAFFSPTDKKWHRVRIHESNAKIDTVTIFLIDLCKLQRAKRDELYQLCPGFVRFPAPLFRCYLYDVTPKFAKDPTYVSPVVPWSNEACKYFQDVILRRDKIFDGIVFTRSDTIVTKGCIDVYQNVGVVLAEKPPRVNGKLALDTSCTVNAKMVDVGFAVPTGIFATCQHTVSIEGIPLPSFSKQEFDSEFPSTCATTENGASHSASKVVPTMGELNMIWGKDHDGNMELPFVSSIFHSHSTLKNVSLPDRFASRLCQVKMSYFNGPNCIFLHAKHLLPAMRDMETCLEKQVTKEALLSDKHSLPPGTLVACNITDSTHSGMAFWCRGIIKGRVKKGEGYKTLLMDYGNEVLVTLPFLRKLPEYFFRVPCFAIRAHIDTPTCIPRNRTGWTTEAIMLFRRELYAGAKDELFYYLYHSPKATSVPLEEYNQEVFYSPEKLKWIPGPLLQSSSAISAFKDEPMMRSLFVSYGVELFYEVKVERSYFWHFEGVSEFLREYGTEKPSKDPKEPHFSKDLIHLKIFEEVVTADLSEVDECSDKMKKMTFRKPEKKGNPLMDAMVKNNIVPSTKQTGKTKQ